MITKAQVKEAVRKHQDCMRELLAAMMTNDGSKVAKMLDACSASYDVIVGLLEEKYPDSFDVEPDDGEEEIDEEEDEEEVEVEEEDD